MNEQRRCGWKIAYLHVTSDPVSFLIPQQLGGLWSQSCIDRYAQIRGSSKVKLELSGITLNANGTSGCGAPVNSVGSA